MATSSSAAWRVRIALNLKGLRPGQAFHHLRHGGQRAPDYLRLNPQGLVPALETGEGTVLTQSLAICEWLEEGWPEPPLLPSGRDARARVRHRRGLARRADPPSPGARTGDGGRVVDLAANDYLGLGRHPEVVDAAAANPSVTPACRASRAARPSSPALA